MRRFLNTIRPNAELVNSYSSVYIKNSTDYLYNITPPPYNQPPPPPRLYTLMEVDVYIAPG